MKTHNGQHFLDFDAPAQAHSATSRAAAADAVAASLSGGRGERIDADADEIVVRLAAAADRWRRLEDHEEREQAKAVVVYHDGKLLEAVAGQPA